MSKKSTFKSLIAVMLVLTLALFGSNAWHALIEPVATTVVQKTESETLMKMVSAADDVFIGDAYAATYSVKPSATSMNINVKASKTITVSQTYPKRCYLTVQRVTTEKQIVQITSNGWNAKGTAATYTLKGLAPGTNHLKFILKDSSNNKVVATSATVTVTVKSTGGEDIYNYAKKFLGKKYGYFTNTLKLSFHNRAWCADFVSYCAKNASQSKAIPSRASVSELRTAIKTAGGKEHSKAEVVKGTYKPVKGDIIIFKSNGDSHVGIVEKISGSTIYYIDGNNTKLGKAANSSVQYTSKAASYAGFTCVLHPNYQ